MALPSNIPTSFVPRSTAASHKFHADFTGAFNFFAYGVLGVVFVLAIGVFSYGQILSSSQSAKDASLAKAEAAVDSATVESFVRLRDRLSLGKTLLANHIAFSGFFSLLETLMPTTARFVSLNLSVDSIGVVKLEGSGVAKSFNALAAVSTAFAKDGRIKNAIFSNIAVSPKDGSVSFALSASLDPKIVAFSPKPSATASRSPAATSTPVSASTSPRTP